MLTTPKTEKLMNDQVGIHSTSWHDQSGSDERLRTRGLADSAYRPQDNNLWQTYTDGYVDHTHEI